ncbi:MAG: IS5 family transposase [bacterium]|nr:IS5 family transposase [bacterium]
MRAFDREVVDAVWEAVDALLPRRDRSHSLGCHRPRVSDRLCFWGLLIRLVTGASWTSIEAILEWRVSDTTLRARRDEWVEAGVFDKLCSEALAAFDRIVGLDVSDVCVDGSTHKAPCGGEGTGKSPVDRGKLGWKWSIATDRHGIPVGWAADAANVNDQTMLEPTLAAVADTGLIADIETIHLDRGYAGAPVLKTCLRYGIDDIARTPKRRPGQARGRPKAEPLGQRWIVESANSWLSNYGQLRRNTDRKPHSRHAALHLAVTIIITAKLIDWKNRWNPT